jgi:hypothetical protein
MKCGWLMMSLYLIAPMAEASAGSRNLQVLYLPAASEAALSLHPKLKLAKGYPRDQAGDELGIKASRVRVLGICADGGKAMVVRDIVRLTHPEAELAELPNDKAQAVACPVVRAEIAEVPSGYRKEIYPKPGYFTVAEEAPSVVWRFYSRLVELGTTSCRPFEMLARVEAGKYVLDEKRYTGECVPKNAKSGWESREMVWQVGEFRRIGGQGMVELSWLPFNRKSNENVNVLLGFECNRISEVKRWEHPKTDLALPTRMRASGKGLRPWEQLDSVQISAGARCLQRWQDSCLHEDTARRQVWNAKECRYDEVPWEPMPDKAELLQARAEFH